jgi:bifunctional DNA-binding transcriptional regulator/antitoxin component of YhaV-PrlF toxin-antitoxin module
MVIFTGKTYENEKGYLYIPVTWREEFDLQSGEGVGIDYKNNFLVIDKETSREYCQTVSARGNLTIPLELRDKLNNETFYILIEQQKKKIILAPKKD